jgi:hypothetical protein
LKPIEEQGYVIMALNSPTVDFIHCAKKLTQSLKHWHPNAKVCLVTDSDQYQDSLWDYYRIIDRNDNNNAWANDWQVFYQSPFRETIKLEADMIIASEIDHWWTMFRHRDLVVSTGCRNWLGEISSARHYRHVFDANNLPDVYNAVTYWRLSILAKEFFDLVKNIFENWDQFKRLIKFPETIPSTDLVYAMAAEIIGREKVTLPFVSYPKIVHMKQYHAGTPTANWPSALVWETDPLRIQTLAQWGVFHYHIKDWNYDS